MIGRVIKRAFSTLPTVSDFNLIDIRLGRIVECGLNPNSEDLYCEKIDMGGKILDVGSKLAKYIPLNEMTGSLVLVVTNLKPRKLAGMVSNGMVLAATKDDTIALIKPDFQAPLGSQVYLEGNTAPNIEKEILHPKKHICQKCFQELRTNQKGEAVFLTHRLMLGQRPLVIPLLNAKIN